MPSVSLSIVSDKPLSIGSAKGKDALRKVVNKATAILSGNDLNSSWEIANVETAGVIQHRAAALWLSGSTGAQTCTIDGTAVAVTYATSTTVTAGLMVTAINANTTANKIVGASQYVGKATMVSVIATDAMQVGPVRFTCRQQNATGTVTCATAIADDTFTLNGEVYTGVAGSDSDTTFNVTGTDTQVAASLVTAINSNAVSSLLFVATSAAGVVTVRTILGGVAGNEYTLASSDGATLAVSGAKLSGGQAVALNTFDVGRSVTETANDLRRAVNVHPELSNRMTAVNVAGVIYFALLENRAARSDETLLSFDSTITINNQIVAGGLLVVSAHAPGLIGNACTCTASGTDASVVTNNTGKLGGGLGQATFANLISSSSR